MNEQIESPIQKIPDPDSIRHRLLSVTKEANLLRQFLRLAERARRTAASGEMVIIRPAGRAPEAEGIHAQ